MNMTKVCYALYVHRIISLNKLTFKILKTVLLYQIRLILIKCRLSITKLHGSYCSNNEKGKSRSNQRINEEKTEN